jgi:hypothetical protein
VTADMLISFKDERSCEAVLDEFDDHIIH